MKKRPYWIGLLLLLFTARVAAQAIDCPQLVEEALASTESFCDAARRNELCYGNIQLTVEAQPDAPEFTFEEAGDITDVGFVRSLQLSSMDVDEGVWGMALMRLQADLPAADAAQNVTVLLFGNVSIENAAEPLVTLGATVSSAQSVNLRVGPGTNNASFAAVAPGTSLTATGRNADSTWLRVRLDDGVAGWIFASLLTVDGNVSDLIVVGDDPDAPAYGPMQAFVFESGVDDRGCDEAPDSGLLIQTPAGVGEVNFLINEVDIRLGSTVYLTAGPSPDGGNQLNAYMIDGGGRFESDGVAQYAGEGQQLSVPLGEDMLANGQPSFPTPYDGSDDALPLSPLQQEVTIAPPFIPDPSAPLITRVDYERESANTTREVIYFNDAEGDVVQLNIGLLDSSDRSLTARFVDTGIAIAAEEQQAGATIVRETECNAEAAGISALFRITLLDATGLESNVVEYRITCPGG